MLRLTCFMMLAVLSQQRLSAQCAFNPTILGDLFLCPNSTTLLETQQYDSYQWYSRGFFDDVAVPIPGATGQSITASSDQAGTFFSVQATLNGCTEFSPEVLLDSYIFLLPSVQSAGDFWVNQGGVMNFCSNDVAMLVMEAPYLVNIQWFRNNEPIPGATHDTLFLTESGNYTVQGAPLVCPDLIEPLGLDIPVQKVEVQSPAIAEGNYKLSTLDAGNFSSYQWFKNGQLVGVNPELPAPGTGDYVLKTIDNNGCDAASTAYRYVDCGTVGAQWYYSESYFFTPAIGYHQMSSTGQVTFQGKTCRTLQNSGWACNGRPLSEIIYQEDKKIFYYNEPDSAFHLLYDFGKQVGESWNMEIRSENQEPDTFVMTVTGIENIVINGVSLKAFRVTAHNPEPQYYYFDTGGNEAIIYEKIGAASQFFPWTFQVCDGTYINPLRCYDDSEVGHYDTGAAPYCDYTPVFNIPDQDSRVLVFPNPAASYLHIRGTGKFEVAKLEVTLWNALGQKVQSGVLLNDSDWSLNGLPAGIYQLTVQNSEGLMQTQSVVIQ